MLRFHAAADLVTRSLAFKGGGFRCSQWSTAAAAKTSRPAAKACRKRGNKIETDGSSRRSFISVCGAAQQKS